MSEPTATTGEPAAVHQDPPRDALRPPDQVMRLERLGALHQTRLSFVRQLLRRMRHQGWRIASQRFDIGPDGSGEALYSVDTPAGRYSFVVFAQEIDPADRTDRVIAERWDYTFALVEGEPDAAHLRDLRANVPLQEAGRCCSRDLVLSRGNKSVRLFEHVVDRLAQGRQPDVAQVGRVGYLMRTTAVYGNGKFGLADYARLQCGSAFPQPFAAQMLTVYLARQFSLDLVEHLARLRNPAGAAALTPALRRAIGVGNATGLGMAPFVVSHPRLIDAWVTARETAIARVKAVPQADAARQRRFAGLLRRAIRHVEEWPTDDPEQRRRIETLQAELAALAGDLLAPDGTPALPDEHPWRRLCTQAARRFSLETQELLNSLILEPYPDLVDDLEAGMTAEETRSLDPGMSLGALKRLIEARYAWALEVDWSDPAATRFFWYRSEAKEEPRLGVRGADPGDDREMVIGIGREVARLHAELAAMGAAGLDAPVGTFVLRRPEHRALVRRIQALAGHPYAEIRDNLLGAEMRPVDLLRFKLAFFGAVRFDPKSDRWTRITLFQGAPLPDDLADPQFDCDDWFAPTLPAAP